MIIEAAKRAVPPSDGEVHGMVNDAASRLHDGEREAERAERPEGVSDEDLIAIARYLERSGVPELAGDYFPADTRRQEQLLRVISISSWTAFVAVFVYDLSNLLSFSMPAAPSRWWLLVPWLAAFAFLRRRELSQSRSGPRRRRRGAPWLVALVLLRVVQIGAASLLLLYAAAFTTTGDPSLTWIAAFVGDGVLAWLVCRFVLVRVAGRNLGRLILAMLQATARGATTAPRLATTMPAMLAIVAFLFISRDTWDLFGHMESWRFRTLAVLVAVIVAGLMYRRLPPHFRAVVVPDDESLALHALETPARAIVRLGVELPRPLPRVPWHARVSLLVPLWSSCVLRVLAGALTLAAVLTLFGILAYDQQHTTDLASKNARIYGIPFTGGGMVVSDALVQVAVLLSVIGAGFFVAVTLGDEAVQRQFFADEPVGHVAEVLSAWAYYSAALAARRPRFCLHGKPVYRSDLRGMDLRGADLAGADLAGADLTGAVHDERTTWPPGVDPGSLGVRRRRWSITQQIRT